VYHAQNHSKWLHKLLYHSNAVNLDMILIVTSKTDKMNVSSPTWFSETVLQMLWTMSLEFQKVVYESWYYCHTFELNNGYCILPTYGNYESFWTVLMICLKEEVLNYVLLHQTRIYGLKWRPTNWWRTICITYSNR
jgi:hypothetical protein